MSELCLATKARWARKSDLTISNSRPAMAYMQTARAIQESFSLGFLQSLNEAAGRIPLDLLYKPTPLVVDACWYVASSDDKLFGSDS